MEDTSQKSQSKQICLGLLAHVDAGKTTLSESLLYTSGTLRILGRVDNRDAFLDTYELERARGITIFSKQAVLTWKDMKITLLDTPGHVDFSAEMERTLQVLDYAVLVISGADGVQGHTQTLWRLLRRYQIPVFLFINKMDQNGTDEEKLLSEIQERLDSNCLNFATEKNETFYDTIAMCEEAALEQFLEQGIVQKNLIQKMIRNRKVFPCYFGSALKLQGITQLLDGILEYAIQPDYGSDFAAKVFKIARDEQGSRLTYLKVTGGMLPVRMKIWGTSQEGEWEEKINQIRIYSGTKYETYQQVEAGTICAVTGLTQTRPGMGLGAEKDSAFPLLEPVLTYRMILPEEIDATMMIGKLRQLEEEEPELHIVWDEQLQEIQAQLMGEVQTEILVSRIRELFGVEVGFGTGNIVYKETIGNKVEGVGHYEPLRHYAEVHLLLEPLERGAGLQFASDCSEDILDRNWQRLVLTHLEEREHKGVLTGSPITDMKITLIAGRAHLKHTEGGDFRQAVYRAVRQGLMQAESILLEPYYAFRLEVPEEATGRAMTDIQEMNGKMEPLELQDGIAILKGTAPVASMQGYQTQVHAYTRGRGRLQCTVQGYDVCHNTDDVLAQKGYDPDRDVENPSSSVFCAHGAGFLVEWQQVKDYMHVESPLQIHQSDETYDTEKIILGKQKEKTEQWIGTDEIDEILAKNTSANKRDKSVPRKNMVVRKRKINYDTEVKSTRTSAKRPINQKEYFLVDGYNVIFAWKELQELAKQDISGARGRLLDIMCNYQALKNVELIVVFDAYRVEGHQTEYYDYHNIHVVFTKEAETADQYIERFAHEHGKQYQVTVATSDGLEQIIIRGAGCRLVSSRELEEEVRMEQKKMRDEYLDRQPQGRNRPFEEAVKNYRET